MRHLLAALLLLAPNLFAQELPVTPAVPAPSIGNEHPAAATSGDLTLVVWWSDDTIRAARLDAAGRLLDPKPILLGSGWLEPGVAALPGGGFLVAFGSSSSCGQVIAVRVNRDGTTGPRTTVADIPPPSGRASSRCPFRVQLATNGETVLALFDDLIGGRYTVLLDGNGNPLAGAVTLAIDESDFEADAVASDGRDYLAVFPTNRNVTAIPISRRGEVGAAQVAFPLHAVVGLASNGSGYLLAVAQNDLLTLEAVGSDGRPSGAATTAPLSPVPVTVRLAAAGSGYAVAWMQPSQAEVSVGRVDAGGTLRDVAGAGPGGELALTVSAGNAVVVRDDAWRLFARTGGGDDVAVAMGATSQQLLQMVSTPDGAAVLWSESWPPAVRVEMLDAEGRPAGKVVDVPARQSKYEMVFDGVGLTIVWHDDLGQAFVRRWTTSLEPVDPEPITILGEFGFAPQLAAGGGGTALFLWRDHGAILTRAGAFIPFALPAGAINAAVWNGSEYLVATSLSPLEGNDSLDVRVFRVAPNGALLGPPKTIARRRWSSIDGLRVVPAGDRDLVAWWPNAWGNSNVVAAGGELVAVDGTPDAAGPQQLTPEYTTEGPALAAAGTTYAVAWALPTGNLDQRLVQWRITGGSLHSLPRFTAPPDRQLGLSMVSIGAHLVLGYSRIDADSGAPRVFVLSVPIPARPHAAR